MGQMDAVRRNAGKDRFGWCRRRPGRRTSTDPAVIAPLKLHATEVSDMAAYRMQAVHERMMPQGGGPFQVATDRFTRFINASALPLRSE